MSNVIVPKKFILQALLVKSFGVHEGGNTTNSNKGNNEGDKRIVSQSKTTPIQRKSAPSQRQVERKLSQHQIQPTTNLEKPGNI